MRQFMQLSSEQSIYVLDDGFDLLPSSIPSSQLLSRVLLLVPPAAAVHQLRPWLSRSRLSKDPLNCIIIHKG